MHHYLYIAYCHWYTKLFYYQIVLLPVDAMSDMVVEYDGIMGWLRLVGSLKL